MTRAEHELNDSARVSPSKKQQSQRYLLIWLLVSLLVSAIWFFTTPNGYFWPMWVILGMGIRGKFAGLEALGSLGRKPVPNSDIDAEVERQSSKG